MERLAASASAPWYGSPHAFEKALDTVGQAPGHFRLALHPLWANACLGPLEGPLPPRSLHHELADWVCGQGRPRHTLNAFLADGDWSALLTPVDGLPVFAEARQLLACEMDYRRTPAYQDLCRAMREGRPVRRQQRRLDSVAAIDRYFERYVGLFASVREHGVLPAARSEFTHPWRMGAAISVALGPDGQWVKLPGAKHRVAIAQALGVAHIPVHLGMVHGEAIRQAMREHGLAPLPALRQLVARFRDGAGTAAGGRASAGPLAS